MCRGSKDRHWPGFAYVIVSFSWFQFFSVRATTDYRRGKEGLKSCEQKKEKSKNCA